MAAARSGRSWDRPFLAPRLKATETNMVAKTKVALAAPLLVAAVAPAFALS
jgi:hypothetical protein